MNLRSNEELKARRQSRCAQRGQRCVLTLGALLTIAALGVGAAAVLEAQAIPRVSDSAKPQKSGVVTIAAAGGLAFGTGEVVSKRESANREHDLRAQLQADVVLDVHAGGAWDEISVRRIGKTDVAVLRFPEKSMGKRGSAAEARKLVREASVGTDLVVVTLEAGTRGPLSRGRKPGWKRPEAFAHGLIDAGADLVVGRDPAELRGLEWYKGRLIAYSLAGGSADESVTERARQSMNGILRITLTPAGTWIEGRLLPLRFERAEDANLSLASDTFGAIRAQSRADFGSSAVRVLRNGSLRPPRKAPA